MPIEPQPEGGGRLHENVVNATTTLQDIVDSQGRLFGWLAPSGQATAFEASIFFTTNAVNQGLGLAMRGPAGVTPRIGIYIPESNGGLMAESVNTWGTVVQASTSRGEGTQAMAFIRGSVYVPKNVAGGVVAVQFKARSAAPNAVTVLWGSVLEVQDLPMSGLF